MEIDPKKHRTINGKEASLGLRHKEVILTFDDGPIKGNSARILKSLKEECVKATFFYVGTMARAYPALVRRVVREGHTLAHHTHSHNRLPKFSSKKAEKLIDRGVSRLQKIAYNDASITPRTPFFRYPYLARNKRTDRLLAKKGLIAFGANIDALDWKKNTPKQIHNRIMGKLRKQGRGIILMHDIHSRTARMLPDLLDTLKAEGYKVVHIVAKKGKKAKPDPAPLVVASLNNTKNVETYGTLPLNKETPAKQVAEAAKTAQKRRDQLRLAAREKQRKARAQKRKLAQLRPTLFRLAANNSRPLVKIGRVKLRRTQWILR
ncbi:MAG: polysaccharide deacetylase family protein [Rhizobiaceae bacterium]